MPDLHMIDSEQLDHKIPLTNVRFCDTGCPEHRPAPSRTLARDF